MKHNRKDFTSGFQPCAKPSMINARPAREKTMVFPNTRQASVNGSPPARGLIWIASGQLQIRAGSSLGSTPAEGAC